MGLRAGVSVPVGDATGAGNDSLSRRYSWQFPLLADLGWKVSDALFLGGYVGVGFGGMGSDSLSTQYCEDRSFDYEEDIDCSTFGFQLGAQAIYSLDPGARWNPWIGYGIGFESARQSIVHDRRNYSEVNTASGITAAKLMFGADYRATVGIGPYVEAAIGRYLQTKTELNDDTVHSGSISNQAFHAWLTFGVRLVVMP
jgi:opacity protein-like surface antigen